MQKQLKYSEKDLKTAEKCENPPNLSKYRGHGFQNSFIALPVSKNPMLEKRILNRKKVSVTIQALGGHLGF